MQISHNKTRLEQFSDGVFAIAITLLALELAVPHITGSGVRASLWQLMLYIPNILTFMLSFFAIAIFWVNHHQLTQEIGPIRRRLLWTNVLLLFFVTLIPFGTEAVGNNPLHPLSVITYAFILFAGSVSFSMLRYFVHKSIGERHVAVGRSLVGPLIYLLAMLAAPFAIVVSYILLAVPPLFYFLPKSHDGTI